MLYVTVADSRGLAAILNDAASVPILTVGDSEEFIRSCGMIRFIRKGNNVKFQIDPDPALRVSIRISSKLLQLADENGDIVRPEACRR